MTLTERILSRLPGNRLAWIVAWVLVPWVNLLVVLWAGGLEWETTQELSIELLNRAAVSFALLLSLWGTARIGTDLSRVRLALTEAVEEDQHDVDSAFRGIDNIAIPLLMTAVVAIVLPVDEVLRGEPLAAVIQGVTWLFIGIPLATVVWVYLALQLGLNRLGRGRLTVKRYSGDRTLGLQPVGTLAFTGFWMLFGTVTPLILTSFADLPTVLVGSAVLIAGLVMFFVSLSGLHRQMAAIRQRELDDAGALY